MGTLQSKVNRPKISLKEKGVPKEQKKRWGVICEKGTQVLGNKPRCKGRNCGRDRRGNWTPTIHLTGCGVA
eukprot:296085-Amorphochlora_amoeboformis.AAC.1